MRTLVIALALALSGCITGMDWVSPDGRPADPLVRLRCDEYVSSKNGPRFTGFEGGDYRTCMKAHGYDRGRVAN